MGPIQLAPELTFAAIGALAGVLIQVWNSYLGRRSDRVLKTYETKLEISLNFLFAIGEISEMDDYLKKQTNSDLQAFLTAKSKLNEAHAIADSLERELKSEPPPPDVAAVLRARASDEAQQIDTARSLVAKMAPQMDRLSHDLEAKEEALKTTRADLRRLGFKLRLIVGDDD